MRRKRQIERAIAQGIADARAGKSIDAFYEMPEQKSPKVAREMLRAAYETGWREAKKS